MRYSQEYLCKNISRHRKQNIFVRIYTLHAHKRSSCLSRCILNYSAERLNYRLNYPPFMNSYSYVRAYIPVAYILLNSQHLPF